MKGPLFCFSSFEDAFCSALPVVLGGGRLEGEVESQLRVITADGEALEFSKAAAAMVGLYLRWGGEGKEGRPKYEDVEEVNVFFLE